MAIDLRPFIPFGRGALSQATDPFRAAVEFTLMPMLITNPHLPDNPIVFANPAFLKLTGYEADEVMGRNCRFLQGHGTDPAHVRAIKSAIAAEKPIDIDIINYKKSGEAFWNRLHISPVHNADGRLQHFVSSQLDVTLELGRLVELEKERNTLSIETARSKDQLDYIVEVANIGFWTREFYSGKMTCSAECRRIYGFTPDEPVHFDTILDLVVLEDRMTVVQKAHQAITGEPYSIEYRIVTRLGETRWLETRAKALTGENPLVLGIVQDVTERKKAEANKALVSREIAHRFKNSMAMVQSIANQTLRNTYDPEQANRLFSERLRALSQAHDMLLKENWAGATIQQICATALAPFNSTFANRIHMSGPHLLVSDRVTVALSLAFYELATNAVKYGALSNEKGVINITWAIIEDKGEKKFHMRWAESRGPEVMQPARRGFGQRLLHSVLAEELKAKCDVEFAASGLLIDVLAPITPEVFPGMGHNAPEQRIA
ncbi:PAS domain S-box protein [Brucella sp. 10RB9214]|uniref:blue-light-activated histidine kinase n=1 Tax=unclassified Brucella TaxID=2632610 RepID=UPI000972E3E4|nr:MULTISPECIES: blue-light-activated histidine kinase [unclassified Brucella]APY15799.1 DNA helicase [Brucella sp. 09RB8910]MRN45900.1 PAS domain S-box protein [Brucella sp. 10RB9212]MRN50794.1 PAS domain S-box protein [Brucella sp. 10RB9214]